MKGSKILIDYQSHMTNVSLLDSESVLKECYVEYNESNRITGNIYRGRVTNVLAGLQSAFVDIGLSRNGFLSVAELMEDRTILKKSNVLPDTLNIKEGDSIMVQVTKEPVSSKGPRVSMNISLPGRYVVYMPTIDFIGISNKITDEDTREKLFSLLNKHKLPGTGLIARTVCRESKKQEIVSEIKILYERYEQIKKRFEQSVDRTLIHHESGLLLRTVRDMLNSDVKTIICNDRYVLESLKRYISDFEPISRYKLELYEGTEDMGRRYGTLKEIDKLLERKVMLPSGGHLIIDYTEALTAIDVNTGSFIGADNHEDTVFTTNMEAAVEIARQLRLRNIGGIIVVDFIDMTEPVHRERVVDALRHEATYDRTRTRIIEMTELGLVQITRKKTGRELSAMLLDACPYCKGFAFTHSADYIARKIKADLMDVFSDSEVKSAVITVHESISGRILKSGFLSDYCRGVWSDKMIYIVGSENTKPDTFNIRGIKSAVLSLPDHANLLY